MQKEYLVIVGVILGWLLNQTSSYFKSKEKDKKRLKRALSYLLELYHKVRRFDLDKIVDSLTDKFSEILDMDANQQLELRSYYKRFLTDYLTPYFNEQFESLKSEYNDAINTLAETDPILAFNLRNKTYIYNYLDGVDQIFEHGTEERYHEAAAKATKHHILKSTTDNLESSILELAKKIGLGYRIKIRKKLSKMKEISFEELDELIDGFISDYMVENNRVQ